MDHDPSRLPPLPPEIAAHYETGLERERLSRGRARLELARTQTILRRFLPAPPARLFDVGGGPGVYAAWLARKGYEVDLLDPVPLHVDQAREASALQPDRPFSAELGDARSLPSGADEADAVLLLGPLYHLAERDDRLLALREATRVLRPGGVVLCAAISRFASLFDGLTFRFLDDPAFADIVERDLRDGQHRNPTNHPGYFSTSYFHHPDELAQEVREAGLAVAAVLAIEGPGWLLHDLDEWWEDERRRQQLLRLTAALEGEPSLLGATAHLMAVGRRPLN